MTAEGTVGVIAGLIAGSVALTGFGLDSAIEGAASAIVIWRFTGGRESSDAAERRAQKLVGASFFLLASYIAAEALLTLVDAERPSTSWVGIGLALGSIASRPGEVAAGSPARILGDGRGGRPEHAVRLHGGRRAGRAAGQHGPGLVVA